MYTLSPDLYVTAGTRSGIGQGVVTKGVLGTAGKADRSDR